MTPPQNPDEPDVESVTDGPATPMGATENGFLDGLDTGGYPSMLRLTSETEASYRRDALDRLERWEDGEEVPYVINFQDPSDLRALLTDRRIALLRSIMRERPSSIRALATRVDRDLKSVHDDLQVLAEYDIVHFEEVGRAKQPFVPYETVEVNLAISAES